MADSDVPGLSALTGANLADGDLFHVVDVSDTSAAADGTDKKITKSELAVGLGGGVPVGLMPLARSGYYYSTVIVGGELTSTAVGGGYIVILPILLATGTLDRLGFHLQDVGDSGDEIGMALWEDDGDGRPGSLVVDTGGVAVDSGGDSDIEITISEAVTDGMYWLGMGGVVTGAPTVASTSSDTHGGWSGIAANDRNAFYQRSASYLYADGGYAGAFDDPGWSGDKGMNANPSSSAPIMWVRYA